MSEAELEDEIFIAKLFQLPRLSGKQYAFYLSLCAVPIILACSFLPTLHAVSIKEILCFFVLAVVIGLFPVKISDDERGYLSASLPATMAILYMAGAFYSIAIGTVSVVVQSLFFCKAARSKSFSQEFQRILFAVCREIVSVGVIAIFYNCAVVDGLFTQRSWLGAIALSVGALATHFLGALLITSLESSSQGIRWDIVWFENFRWTDKGALLMCPLGFVAGALAEQNLAYGIGMLSIVLIAAQRGFALHKQKQDVYREAVDLLAGLMLEAHPYTHGHIHRVAAWAKKIGRKIGLNAHSMSRLEEAAILHDIGKVAIDDRILNKIGRLSDGEWSLIKRHPEIGADIVEKMSCFEDVSRWIKHHHERIDGMGYPLGLKGTDIPIESRIISVVDAFDAMVDSKIEGQRRVYCRSIPPREACNELIRCSGTQFDADIVRAFVEILKEEGLLNLEAVSQEAEIILFAA